MDAMGDMEYLHDLLYMNRERRRRRVRPDFANSMSEIEFHRNFRFSKEGVDNLLNRVGDHLQFQDNRETPMTPMLQVDKQVEHR